MTSCSAVDLENLLCVPSTLSKLQDHLFRSLRQRRPHHKCARLLHTESQCLPSQFRSTWGLKEAMLDAPRCTAGAGRRAFERGVHTVLAGQPDSMTPRALVRDSGVTP